ncbi:DUF4349 domain-containing protein [Geomonas oryzisoli]|uniref:DUF4349 domain-containing protein n=1 Tax=Geomonas oryzisoli TaxID=2847992 RepID=A0ABX8J6Z4_9BACT|nr:DUF4349 domain-containing protein [Geomonas oryzisoli]QWV94210.1 DUF4349 domain-containing protein [Geomonas oryzisoli]
MSCKKPLSHRIVMSLVFLLLACQLTACKKKEEAPAPVPASAAAPAAKNESAAPEGESSAQGAPRQAKRKVIVSREMSLEVKSYQVALDALTKLAESSGGYLFKSSRESDDGVTSGEVGLRVPAGETGNVLRKIGGLGKITQETASAEDITEGYVDLQARLGNAKASEARLLSLYQRAGELSDVLEVEKELTRVRGDIEAFEAKRKNWDLLVEMATIEIRLCESSNGLPSARRLWTPLKSAFGTALEGLADSIHALIVIAGTIGPWAALFGTGAYFWIRRKGPQKGPVETKETTETISQEEDYLP